MNAIENRMVVVFAVPVVAIALDVWNTVRKP
jgi:hypothetical protein